MTLVPTAVAEILSLPLRLLAELPAASTLSVSLAPDRDGGPTMPLVLTTSRARYQAAAAGPGPSAPCLSPVEYEALAVALADGRCSRRDALAGLAAKARDASVRLDAARLLGPVRRPDGGGAAWTVGQLLEALGGEIVAVEVHEAAA